ncbi:uncharacterized protein LOC125651414 isoform X2 [Ostrea edulis]|uniref:uncharacterized protein LOC125651414 isoform X2 n=1 Tax=Ostrea edulis TaxID=37623 RepID=UPI0024AF2E89|nr:uncharacterized protein LOC125651414 isoform X2 [Ostrea edulis]
MWQRIRDYSSAINFTILNFLRKRNYEQFDENGDGQDRFENSQDGSESAERDTVDCITKHTDTCAIIDHVEVHSFSDRQISTFEKESRLSSYDGDTESEVNLDVSVGRSHYTNNVNKRDENESLLLGPRDVKDVVHSYTQNRYKRLEDEDECSEDERDFQITVADETNPVFHSAKDFSKKKKSSKTKRRKKIAKMTRRSIRGSWKWLKQGVMGYAGGLATANLFMLFHTRQ